MTQSKLNRAVARATGENLSMIWGLGFVPLTQIPFERKPKTVYGNEVNVSRNMVFQPHRKGALAVH